LKSSNLNVNRAFYFVNIVMCIAQLILRGELIRSMSIDERHSMQSLIATLIHLNRSIGSNRLFVMSQRNKSKSSKSNKTASTKDGATLKSDPAPLDRITLEIKVRPNAGSTFIEKVNVQSDALLDLHMNVKEAPENNEANRAIIKFISKLLSLHSDDVSLISGAKSKSKSFQVRNWKPTMVLTLQQNAS
jgi:uncharacterized protein YggU (UPF0235/DUF167 family)